MKAKWLKFVNSKWFFPTIVALWMIIGTITLDTLLFHFDLMIPALLILVIIIATKILNFIFELIFHSL